MKRSFLSFVLALAPVALIVACPAAPVTKTKDKAPGPIEAACTTPSSVACRDQSEVALGMTPNDVTPGVVDNTTLSDRFHTHVDATAGGFPATQGYVYAKFDKDAGLKKVGITDDASYDSMDWDISFHRFIIRLNSGTGGPSCVTAARTAPNTAFADVKSVDEDLSFNAEQFMSPDTCDIIPDGSGLPDAPGVVLQNYWKYQSCLQMTGNVYIIELADGHHVKLVVTDYYSDAAQADCDQNGSNDDTGLANLQFDWAFVD